MHKIFVSGAALLFLACGIGVSQADVITDWNQTALRTTDIAGTAVPVQTRAMAMVHAAMFDAVNACLEIAKMAHSR